MIYTIIFSITPAELTITAKDQSIYIGGTVPTLSGADFYITDNALINRRLQEQNVAFL